MTPSQQPSMDRENERSRIQAAADRLLAGKPIHSTGELTVVQLAIEAGVKRWVLTHRHVDLMQSFQSGAKQQSRESPIVEPWRKQVKLLEEKLTHERDENAELRRLNNAYAQAIHDLGSILDSHEPSAPLPFKRNRT